MKCLRCGYCCVEYDVVIVDDPEIGPEAENLKYKPSGTRCQHLRGDAIGQYSCAIHDYPWYEETPCYGHGQVEQSPDDPCRIGEYMMRKKDASAD